MIRTSHADGKAYGMVVETGPLVDEASRWNLGWRKQTLNLLSANPDPAAPDAHLRESLVALLDQGSDAVATMRALLALAGHPVPSPVPPSRWVRVLDVTIGVCVLMALMLVWKVG